HFLAIAAKAPKTSGLRQADSFASYNEIAERVGRLAAGLQDRGVGQGSVVALLIPNSPEIFVVTHALWAIGAIAMPLGPTATHTEPVALTEKTGFTAVLAAPASVAAAETLIAAVAPTASLFRTDALAALETSPGA